MSSPRTCPCGSDEEYWSLEDGYGIFMCYACDVCVASKLAKYRNDIFERYPTQEQIEEDY
jgi:hypothetical protein